MMKAVRLNPTTIREDAKRLLSLIKENNQSEDDILNAKEGELAEIFNHVRSLSLSISYHFFLPIIPHFLSSFQTICLFLGPHQSFL